MKTSIHHVETINMLVVIFTEEEDIYICVTLQTIKWLQQLPTLMCNVFREVITNQRRDIRCMRLVSSFYWRKLSSNCWRYNLKFHKYLRADSRKVTEFKLFKKCFKSYINFPVLFENKIVKYNFIILVYVLLLSFTRW